MTPHTEKNPPGPTAFPYNDPLRDWPEDAKDTDNGCYSRACLSCGKKFVGHKRRVYCKACNQPVPVCQHAPGPTASVVGSEEVQRLREGLRHIGTLAHCISKAGPLNTPTLEIAWDKFDEIAVEATRILSAQPTVPPPVAETATAPLLSDEAADAGEVVQWLDAQADVSCESMNQHTKALDRAARLIEEQAKRIAIGVRIEDANTVERWRNASNRMRDEMEHQARLAVEAQTERDALAARVAELEAREQKLLHPAIRSKGTR